MSSSTLPFDSNAPDPFPELTRFLAEWHQGQQDGLTQIVKLTYQELHKLAVFHFNRVTPGDTLQPTALVSEVYLRLKTSEHMKFEGRTQFFWFAGQLMRQILVDYFRAKSAAKRGGDAVKIPLNAVELPGLQSRLKPKQILNLDAALNAMQRFDPRQSRILEMFYFAGLKVEEIATAMALSPTTIKRELRSGRHWLATRI